MIYKTNKRTENIKSMLYCAIHFRDFQCIESILHPNGIFLGMSKQRFIYFLRKEFFDEGSEFISEDSVIWSVMIEVSYLIETIKVKIERLLPTFSSFIQLSIGKSGKLYAQQII
jgi:hypothetical protein